MVFIDSGDIDIAVARIQGRPRLQIRRPIQGNWQQSSLVSRRLGEEQHAVTDWLALQGQAGVEYVHNNRNGGQAFNPNGTVRNDAFG